MDGGDTDADAVRMALAKLVGGSGGIGAWVMRDERGRVTTSVGPGSKFDRLRYPPSLCHGLESQVRLSSELDLRAAVNGAAVTDT